MNWQPLHFWGNLLWKILVGVFLLDISHRMTTIMVNQGRITKNQRTTIDNQVAIAKNQRADTKTIIDRIDGR